MFFSLSSNTENILYHRSLAEYSRRHPELSTPELLRMARVHDDLLKECCNAENAPDCYSNAVGSIM